MPSTKPTLMVSSGFARTKFWSAFATGTGSCVLNTSPVGPLKWLPSGPRSRSFTASRASRFFTTLYSAAAALSCFRRSASWRTVSPRYSVSTAVLAVPSRSRRAATLCAFS